MIISIIQPCFIPWLGYFEQMIVSDVFVYMDDVQYTRKDWRNDNQLKSPDGVKNVYFPVRKTSRDTLIKDVEISYSQPWEETFLSQITQWYRKAPFFRSVVDAITPPLTRKYTRLVELNLHLNNAVLEYLGIQKPTNFTSLIPRTAGDKNGRVLEICKYFDGVDLLYDGKKAANFIDVELFRRNGVEVVFQDYQHTPYTQLHGPFEPYMSIVDLLMNQGPNSKGILLSSPRPPQLARRSTPVRFA